MSTFLIAVVEDEPILQEMVQMELEQAKYDVCVASDGEAGLAMVREKCPQLLLLDLMLPKMNGYEVLEAIKKDESIKSIPVIILSNLGQEQEKQRAMDLGAHSFYIKATLDLDQLVQTVGELVGRPSQ